MWCIPLKANTFFWLMVKVGHLSHLKRALWGELVAMNELQPAQGQTRQDPPLRQDPWWHRLHGHASGRSNPYKGELVSLLRVPCCLSGILTKIACFYQQPNNSVISIPFPVEYVLGHQSSLAKSSFKKRKDSLKSQFISSGIDS